MNQLTATLDQVEISAEDVCKRLKAVKAYKLPGLNWMNPAFLKGLAELSSGTYGKDIQMSLKEHILPHT